MPGASITKGRLLVATPVLDDPNFARTVIYVVCDGEPVLGAAWRRLNASVIGPAFTTASTLLGVTQLGFSGQLVEVDLTAALPG